MEHSLRRDSRYLIYAILLGSLALRSAYAEDSSRSPNELNGGYYLLHRLMDDESNVSMLMMVKHAPAEIVKFTDDVSTMSKKNLEALDRFRDGDASIRFDQNPLPAVEQDVRDSIKADKQHQLLFGTTDSEFVRAFLVSQLEASTYALHLNKVIAEHESDPARAKTLRNFSNDWGMARARAYRLLRSYSR